MSDTQSQLRKHVSYANLLSRKVTSGMSQNKTETYLKGCCSSYWSTERFFCPLSTQGFRRNVALGREANMELLNMSVEENIIILMVDTFIWPADQSSFICQKQETSVTNSLCWSYYQAVITSCFPLFLKNVLMSTCLRVKPRDSVLNRADKLTSSYSSSLRLGTVSGVFFFVSKGKHVRICPYLASRLCPRICRQLTMDVALLPAK